MLEKKTRTKAPQQNKKRITRKSNNARPCHVVITEHHTFTIPCHFKWYSNSLPALPSVLNPQHLQPQPKLLDRRFHILVIQRAHGPPRVFLGLRHVLWCHLLRHPLHWRGDVLKVMLLLHWRGRLLGALIYRCLHRLLERIIAGGVVFEALVIYIRWLHHR